MATRILLTVILAIVFTTTAWSAETTRAVDFIRFADNGNDIVVDLPGLVRALRSGADPNLINCRAFQPGETWAESTLFHFVYMCSISRGDPQTDAVCVQTIKALVADGAKLQTADRKIFFWPVASGKADIVALLLDLGADAASWPNDDIHTNYSPVEFAAKEGHQAVVDLLVEHGATRPKERDVIQWRFIQAAENGSVAWMKELLKKGAYVNEKGRDDETALIKASGLPLRRRECEGFRNLLYLLDAGANPNISGNGGSGATYPLHQAVRYSSFLYNADSKGSSQCVEMILSELITRGAHVSSLDSDGQTPLHSAAKHNHLLAARLLLKAGAKVMPRDKEGKTPLDLAESGELITLLKSHGATER